MKFRRLQRELQLAPKTAETAAVIEADDVELRFNPLLELPENGLACFEVVMRNCRELIGTTNYYVYVVEALSVAFSGQKDELGIEDGDFDLLKQVKEENNAENFLWSLSNAAAMAVIFPERRAEIEIDDQLFINAQLELNAARDSAETYCRIMHHIAILFPERISEFKFDDIPDEVLREIKSDRTIGDWELYSEKVYNLAIAFPDKRKDLGFDEEAFQAIYKELQSNNRSGNSGLISTAALYLGRLTALTADEIRVTANGIELINRGALQKEQELPERRLT